MAACAPPTADLTDPPVDLGDFKLGHNIVVTPDPKLVPGSRRATDEEWKAAMTGAIDARFGRYEDGTRLYHFGISIDAYNLAAIDLPGVPTPKSALGVTVTVWYDAKGAKLNEKPKTITVLGIFSGAGIQPSKQVQLDNLSALAAREIQEWLLENPEWFGIASEPDS
ncbi:hypothetical protein AIOL_004273 [Candidatus Rhodobacter oscarellae]|uniref:Uncharacterized protein n=2 Tax=Candidatus Rhodobacter oscarellae TaxID=1675527 RepID=A0A0J9E922_9RHOB|nr:hypothetical protein AIOL_004273 [Candidatus Rhodobacter lobularis]